MLLADPDPARLEQLFATFGPHWWMQRRPHSFRLSEEYDRLLPAHYVLAPALRLRSGQASGHPTALASLHAVHHMVSLARAARAAVIEGRYAAFRAAVLEKFRSRATLAPAGGN